MSELICADCKGPHWIDTSLPSDVWNRIATPDTMLCPACIDKRLQAAGMTAEAEFYYGGKALKSKMYALSHRQYVFLRNQQRRWTILTLVGCVVFLIGVLMVCGLIVSMPQ